MSARARARESLARTGARPLYRRLTRTHARTRPHARTSLSSRTRSRSARICVHFSLTRPQAEYLQQFVGMDDKKWAKIATSVMRARGVRRDNLEKNTGSRYFAFNKVQVRGLPLRYRPPVGCFGGKVT